MKNQDLKTTLNLMDKQIENLKNRIDITDKSIEKAKEIAEKIEVLKQKVKNS